MTAARIIKKYPNRRLYDTEESRYITLANVRDLVLEQVDFTVIDKKSGQDITRPILLQVISEQEQLGDAVMSAAFLMHVIRSCGRRVPQLVSAYLEQSMALFMAQQQGPQGQVREVAGGDPRAAVAAAAQQNFQRWQSGQGEARGAFAGGAGERPEATPETPAAKRKRAG